MYINYTYKLCAMYNVQYMYMYINYTYKYAVYNVQYMYINYTYKYMYVVCILYSTCILTTHTSTCMWYVYCTVHVHCCILTTHTSMSCV